MSTSSPPGWYPHPTKRGKYGYFNGRNWDEEVRDAPPAGAAARPQSGERDPLDVLAGRREASQNAPIRTTGSPVSPWAIIGIGLIVAVVGSVLLAVDDGADGWARMLGLVASGLASIVILVGAVAAGVVFGLRYDREGPT
ncbi:hypothetical protein [Nocardioides sp. 1609]|uniref:hypothetical protein n=1 Tax=Nocardioides sp. 1609 TaxID=2508327 RepID=UPI00106F1A1A|nr:hypothetical protein [Nocardioides sp. 1609]